MSGFRLCMYQALLGVIPKGLFFYMGMLTSVRDNRICETKGMYDVAVFLELAFQDFEVLLLLFIFLPKTL